MGHEQSAVDFISFFSLVCIDKIPCDCINILGLLCFTAILLLICKTLHKKNIDTVNRNKNVLCCFLLMCICTLVNGWGGVGTAVKVQMKK